MNGVIYCRKSSEDKNKQILSLSDQLKQCQEIANRNSIKIVAKPFIEAKTGWKSEVRTKFYEMLDLIKSGKADTIVAWNLDRIGRNGTENGIIRDLITQGKLRIVTASVTYDQTNTLQTGFENLINEEYSKKLSDVVKARLKLKAERGDYPGQAQIGYKNTPRRLKGQRKIVVDNKKWALMRKWWDMMLTGLYSVDASLTEITKLGLTGKNGKPISRSTAYMLFRNIFYTGSFEYSGSLYPGNHKAMVSMAEWLKVQKILDDKGKKGSGTLEMPREKTFQGMLKCGECGATITMSKHIKHYKNGTSQIFWYYNCTKKLGSCKQPHLNASLFEPQLESYIRNLKLNPNYADWIKKVLKRRNADEFTFEKKQQELRTKKLSTMTDRKKQLYDMKIDGLFSEEEYQKEKKSLLLEEKELRESFTKPTTRYWESVIDNTVNFATAVTRLFDEGDVFTRQMVLKILGSNFTLKDKKLRIQAKNAFIFLKDIEKQIYKENLWIEPEETPKIRLKGDALPSPIQLCAEDRT